MSEVIDSKVVELKFNNAEFEKNVKTSLTTIEKLKKSLNFDTVTTSVNLLQNAFQLKGLKNIQAQLGQVVGAVDKSVSPIMATINSIGDAITNTIGGAISGVVAQIKSGGINRAMNVEKAKFALQGLKIEWNDVKDSISDAVTGTAYGMDAAARAASVLAGSGIDYKKVIGKDLVDTDVELTQMGMVLKSISGVATQTNQDFEQMAHIFSTIAGNGRLMGMQLSQLSQYGMNAAADIGDAIGKTDAEVRDLVSKGKIGADQFFEIMYKKYWANAKKANDTLDGVSRNIRATYSRIGEAFYAPLIENQGPIVKMLGAYKDVIGVVANRLKAPGTKLKDGEGNKLTTFVTKWLIKDVNLVTQFLTDIKNNGDVMKAWRAVYRVLKSGFKIFQMTFNFARSIGQAIKEAFPESFLDYWIDINTHIFNFVNIFYKGSKKIKKNAETMSKAFKGIRGVLEPIYKNVQNMTDAFKQFFDETFDGIDPLQTVVDTISDLCGYLHVGIVETEDWRKGFDALWGIVKHVYGVFKAFGEAVYETFKEGHFHPVQFIIDLLHTLTDGIVSNDKKTNKLKNTFKIFTTIIGVVAKVFGAALLIVAKVFNILFKIGGWVLNITSPIGTLVSKIFELVTGFTDAAKNIDLDKYENLKKVIEGVKDFFGKAKDAVGKFSEKVSDVTENTIGKINIDWPGAFDKVLGAIDNLLGKAKDFKDKIKNNIGKPLDSVKDGINKAFGKESQDNMSESHSWLDKISKIDILGGLGKGLDFIGGVFKDLFDYIKDSPLFSKIGEDLGKFFENVGSDISKSLGSDNLEDGVDGIASAAETLGGGLGRIFAAIGKVIKSFTDSILQYGSSDEVATIIGNMVDVITAFTVYNWSTGFKELVSLAKNGKDWHLMTNFFNTVSNVMQALAKSALMIAASLYIISQIPTDTLAMAAGALGAFLVVLAIIGKSFMGFNERIGGFYGSFKKGKLVLEKDQFLLGELLPVILALAASVLIFAFALNIVKDMDPKDMQVKAIILMEAMALIAGMVNLIVKKGNLIQPTEANKKGYQIVKLAPIIKALALAMLIIAASIWVLGQLPEDKMYAASQTMIGLLTIIGLIMFVLSYMVNKMTRTKGGDFTKSASAKEVKLIFAAIAGVITSIGVAMFSMAKSLAIMALIPQKQMEKGIDAMLACFAIITLLTLGSLAGAKGLGGTEVAITLGAMAGAIIAFSAAMVIMATAMAAFSLISWESIAKGLVAVGVGLAVIVGLGFLAQNFVIGIAAIAGALLAIGATVFIVAFSIKLLIDAFIALGKAGPAAVAGVAIFFGAIGKGLAAMFKGIADSMDSILQGLWDCIVAAGDFLINKLPDIVSFLLDLAIKAIDYLAPGLIQAIGDLGMGIARGIGGLIFGKEYVYEPYKGQLSQALKDEINSAYDDIKNTKQQRIDAIAVKDHDIQYYQDAWEKLQGMIDENGKIKKGYEDQAEVLSDELNEALGAGIKIEGNRITNLDKVNKRIQKSIELKKAENYLSVYGEDYQQAIKDQEKYTKAYLEAKTAADKSQADLDDINGKIAESSKLLDGLDKDTLEWSSEQVQAMADQLKKIDPGKYTDEWIEASWGDIPATLQAETDAMRERAKEVAKVNANEELALSKAAENLDSSTALTKNYEMMEKEMQAGNTKAAEEWGLKLKYNFKTAADATKNTLETQKNDIQKQLDDTNALLKKDPHNQILLDKQKELQTIQKWANDEYLKEEKYSQEELDKMDKEEEDKLDKKVAKRKTKAKKQAKAQTEGAKEGAKEGATDVAETANKAIEDTMGSMDMDKIMKDPLSAINSSGNLKIATDGGFDIGTNIMSGMSDGITSFNMNDTISKATGSVLEQFKSPTNFNINSPSKLIAKRVGSPIMEGLAKGISDNVSMVKNHIAMVRDTVVNAFDSMALDSDYSPTITPVVDLSNVNSAAGSINGLFSNRSIGLSSNIGAVSASMREIQNTDKNAGLIAAINGLNGTTNNNVYNVNGITYDDGSNIADAVGQLINAAMIERRM